MIKKIKKHLCFVFALVILIGNMGITKVEAATIDEVSTERPLAGLVVLDSGTLNVRQYASTGAEIITSLSDGSYIMVVGQSGDFYRVQYNTSGNYGYVAKEFVYLHTDIDCYLKPHIESGTLNMRDGAGTQYTRVASIPLGTAFAFLSDDADHSGWYYGLYGNKNGYTLMTYTMICYFY